MSAPQHYSAEDHYFGWCDKSCTCGAHAEETTHRGFDIEPDPQDGWSWSGPDDLGGWEPTLQAAREAIDDVLDGSEQ